MKNLAFAMILLPFLLAGCGRAAPQNDTVAQVPEGNYLDQIDALPGRQRDMVFMRAMQDSDLDCQRVTGSAVHEKVRGRPTWVAHCDDGRDWIVMLEPGGMIRVVNPGQIGEPDASPTSNAMGR